MSSRLPTEVTRLRDHHDSTTRRVILKAARQLFAERGYQATPVRLLAQQSGVAVQTIYSTFGSKAGVLKDMLDLIDEEAGVLDVFEQLQQTDVPREMLGLFARLRRQFPERCGDIIHNLRSGAASDMDIAAAVNEGSQRRRHGLSLVIERISAQGKLKDELSVERATDIAAAISADEVCDVLVEQGGWSFDDYEGWLSDTLATLLLRDTEVTD